VERADRSLSPSHGKAWIDDWSTDRGFQLSRRNPAAVSTRSAMSSAKYARVSLSFLTIGKKERTDCSAQLRLPCRRCVADLIDIATRYHSVFGAWMPVYQPVLSQVYLDNKCFHLVIPIERPMKLLRLGQLLALFHFGVIPGRNSFLDAVKHAQVAPIIVSSFYSRNESAGGVLIVKHSIADFECSAGFAIRRIAFCAQNNLAGFIPAPAEDTGLIICHLCFPPMLCQVCHAART
jgi:hypothetical protein